MKMSSLAGQRIVITGASQGLGRELALQLARQHAEVIVIARTEQLLSSLVSQIRGGGGSAQYLVCDLTQYEQVKKTAAELLQRFSSIDILVNNAGVWTDNELEQKNPERREEAMMTNAVAHIHLTESLLPHFVQRDKGTIFNVISTAAVPEVAAGNNAYWRSYGASKWAMAGYVQALSTALQGTKIKVTQFCPGGFESNLYENAQRPDAHQQAWMMQTADIAEVIAFVLSRPDDMNIDQLVLSKVMGTKE